MSNGAACRSTLGHYQDFESKPSSPWLLAVKHPAATICQLEIPELNLDVEMMRTVALLVRSTCMSESKSTPASLWSRKMHAISLPEAVQNSLATDQGYCMACRSRHKVPSEPSNVSDTLKTSPATSRSCVLAQTSPHSVGLSDKAMQYIKSPTAGSSCC